MSKTTATPSNALTPAEVDAFLAQRQNARLATVCADGHVQLTPVWYWPDGGKVWFTLGEGRVHLRNLRRSPKATLLMDEDLRLTDGWAAPARAVMLCGAVEIFDDAALAARYEGLMAERYLGEGARDPDFVAAVEAERRYALCLTPERALTWDYSK